MRPSLPRITLRRRAARPEPVPGFRPTPDTNATNPPKQAAERLVDGTVGSFTAATFGLLSFVRRARFFHPSGRAFHATVVLTGSGTFGKSILAYGGKYPAVVRFSRGGGVPEPLPDGLGLAVRLLDVGGFGQHQDLLLVSSATAPAGRNLIVPVRSYGEAFYSSILPFRAGPRTVLFGARPLWTGGKVPSARLRELDTAVTSHRLGFELLAAEPLGSWEPLGTLEIGLPFSDAESESLRFNPFNRSGGIEPAGPINALRRRVYANSQRRRPTPMDDPTSAESRHRQPSPRSPRR